MFLGPAEAESGMNLKQMGCVPIYFSSDVKKLIPPPKDPAYHLEIEQPKPEVKAKDDAGAKKDY